MRFVQRLGLLATAGGVLLAGGGCHYFEKYKSCRDVLVHIVNSEQTLGPIDIVSPVDDDFAPQTLLQSGQTRDVVLCLDRGETAKFKAEAEGQEVAIVRCTANQASYEGSSVSVIWTLQGFYCQGW